MVDARANAIKMARKVAKELKEVIKEIAWLKIELYVARGKINSLEHLIGLERLVLEELRKKVGEFKVIVDVSGYEKAKTIKAFLWAYNLSFRECKVLVKQLFSMINIDHLVLLEDKDDTIAVALAKSKATALARCDATSKPSTDAAINASTNA